MEGLKGERRHNLHGAVKWEVKKCKYCSSKDIIKKGFRKNENGKVRRYKCKECDRWFTPEPPKVEEFSEVLSWLHAMEKFSDFSGMNPEQLIQQRSGEINSSNPSLRSKTRDLVLDFRRYLEKEGYSPSTINTWDGSIRGFYTAILGRQGMINVKNYEKRGVKKRVDLVPTLEELRKILDVCNLEEKFRIIFLAQTGMRISDALKLKVGDLEREVELEKSPLAIRYLPKKEGDVVGERITFLASDGVELLKRYIGWRKEMGEEVTSESPLFVGRTNRGNKAISQRKFSKMLKVVASKAGLNGNGKWGRLRAHSLRKFTVTQLTNHGVEDKIVNFFIGHKIPDVDQVYWRRRVEELRKIYAKCEKHLNPISKERAFDLDKMEDLKAKIEQLEERIEELEKGNAKKSDVKIVNSEDKVVELAQRGYDCQAIGEDRWLMKGEN